MHFLKIDIMFKKRSPIFLLYIEDKILLSLVKKMRKNNKSTHFQGIFHILGGVKIRKTNLSQSELTMQSFHTPTQKIPPTSKNSSTKFQIFTKILKSSISPCFSTKIAPHKNFTPYRTTYRQNPYFSTLFCPFSHKI